LFSIDVTEQKAADRKNHTLKLLEERLARYASEAKDLTDSDPESFEESKESMHAESDELDESPPFLMGKQSVKKTNNKMAKK